MEELEQRKDNILDQQTNEIIERIKGKLGEERIQSILDMIGENNLIDFVTEHPEQFNGEELVIFKEILTDIITSKTIEQCEGELSEIQNDKDKQSNENNHNGKITIPKVEEITAKQELPDIKKETKTIGELLRTKEEKGELENGGNDART